MNTYCLQFRWINASCYEFKLPDGRVITTDPYLDRGDASFGVKDMLSPDIVLCTHTHYDHITEIGDLVNGNDSAKLLVHEISAPLLLDYFGLKFGQVYGLSYGRRLTIDGIDILPTNGKHSRFMVREKEYQSFLNELSRKDCGISDMQQLMLYGSTVYTDYLLTLPHNLRIFFTGGDRTYSAPYEVAREHAPFIVVRQVSNLASPEEYADIVARLGGTIVLPHHQEHPVRRLGMPMEEFTERVNARLADIAPGMQMLNPRQYKWYRLGVTVDEWNER